jgi:tRNA nucleotidyltransferase/poly(A) polymerase
MALVGGIVRDLLRGERAGRDVDLVVEGDAGEFAVRAASSIPGGRVTRHARFGTARIDGEGGFRIDVATANGIPDRARSPRSIRRRSKRTSAAAISP